MASAASAVQGLATFPGVDRILWASFALRPGIFPGTATIEIAPQNNFTPQVGTLAFTCGGTQFAFRQCKVETSLFHAGRKGHTWTLAILDRRRKWSFGEIRGRYNLRRENLEPCLKRQGTKTFLRDGGEVSLAADARRLASLCLDALGETGYDVSDVPSDLFPEVDWDGVNPARALAELCDGLGMTILLGLDDRARIVPAGVGDPLPPGLNVMTDSFAFETPRGEEKLVVQGGPRRIWIELPLEPVGLDVDGIIRPIGNLSYVPMRLDRANREDRERLGASAAWAKADPEHLMCVPEGFGTAGEARGLSTRELARRSVFRWYRIRLPSFFDGEKENSSGATTTKTPPPFERLPGFTPRDGDWTGVLEQILPLLEVDYSAADDVKHLPRHVSPVFGYYATGNDPTWPCELAYVPQEEFTVDRERGIVKFAGPKYVSLLRRGASLGRVYPAGMFLLAAVSVRDANCWQRIPARFEEGEGQSDLERIIVRDAIIPASYFAASLAGDPRGGSGNGGNKKLSRLELLREVSRVLTGRIAYREEFNNEERTRREANRVRVAAMRDYRRRESRSMLYAGLMPLEPNGRIDCVEWRIGPGGTTTRAWQESKIVGGGPSENELRGRRILADMAAEFRKTKNGVSRKRSGKQS